MACRYADCSHTQESDCAVLTAITNGELSKERYFSYLKLRKESEHHEMSYRKNVKRTGHSDDSLRQQRKI